MGTTFVLLFSHSHHDIDQDHTEACCQDRVNYRTEKQGLDDYRSDIPTASSRVHYNLSLDGLCRYFLPATKDVSSSGERENAGKVVITSVNNCSMVIDW